jgi:hypothetical protein
MKGEGQLGQGRPMNHPRALGSYNKGWPLCQESSHQAEEAPGQPRRAESLPNVYYNGSPAATGGEMGPQTHLFFP